MWQFSLSCWNYFCFLLYILVEHLILRIDLLLPSIPTLCLEKDKNFKRMPSCSCHHKKRKRKRNLMFLSTQVLVCTWLHISGLLRDKEEANQGGKNIHNLFGIKYDMCWTVKPSIRVKTPLLWVSKLPILVISVNKGIWIRKQNSYRSEKQWKC